MSVVTIVTDNMVLALEKVEQDTLDGVLFASIKLNDQREIETHAEIFSLSDGPNIGKNVFEQKSGALNDSLRGLDLDSMEEYFYVPPGVFFSHHTGHCPISDETNGTVAWKNTSVLQFVIYENDRLFRTNRNEVAVDTANDVPENEQAEWKVTSRVISATISGRFVWGLETPVIISLKHHKKVGGGGRVLCVFWDFQGGDGSGAWSTKGCRVSFTSASHTICECNHLTNYAVIIDIGAQLGNGSLPRVHCQVLEVISYTGCALSLIGLITTMGMLVSVRKLREAKTTPTRLMLCLSLIISMTFYLTGINQTSSRHACTAFACCIHYFTLVALMWMGVEGAYLYRNIVLVVITPPRHMFKICCTVAWGVPAVIVGGVAIFDLEAYGSFERCWISDPTVFFAAFLVPAMLIVICNFVVFLMVMWVLFKRPFSARRYTTGKEHREYSRRRREIFGIISITALLGLTWILGSFSVGDDGVRLTSLYLFTLFNSTQGFFIFLFYGLLSCLTTRAVPSPVGVPPPLTTATSKLGQLVASTVALNNKILKIRPKRKGSAGESIFTSFSDLPLEFGNNIPAFQCDLSPIGTKKETLACGQRPQVLDLTSCNFVLSAGILNAGNQRPMIYLVNSGPGSDMWAGSDYRKREDFVLGTGIIFSGKS